jgi:hypothetical protein
MNPARLFAAALGMFASSARRALVGGMSVVLAAALTAAAAQAQDKSGTELSGSGPTQRNRIVEIAPNAPDSGASSGSEANSNDADAADGSEEGQQAVTEPDATDSDGGAAQFADQDEFVSNDDVYQSPIGALLQHNCTDLLSRQMACGLAVLEVRPGTPAAAAGMRPYSGLVHTLLGATIVSAAMVFPPAFAAIGLVDQTHVGESYDLIIGVDGRRIHTIHDFEVALINVRFGDVLYLTIVRAGKRLQIPMRVTQ